jgi:hypothetical protein
MSIALNFYHILKHIGFKVFIKTDISDYDCDNDDFFYIIIHNPTPRNPKKYIHYQIEQTTSTWFTPQYISSMRNSEKVWEFAMPNYKKYMNEISIDKVYYMPMPFYKYYEYRSDMSDTPNDLDKNLLSVEYDILFYGSINKRRSKILNKLSEKYKIKTCINVFGEDIYAMIKKAKIILNIHFYEDATLESARFNEVLQFNRLIVSERSINDDSDNMDIYKNIVSYVDTIKNDLSNIDQLYVEFDKWLKDDAYLSRLKDNVRNIEMLQEYSIKCVNDYFKKHV